MFRAVARALRPGGRLAIADIVSARELIERTRRNVALWAACIAGAVPHEDYLGAIEAAGLRVETVRANALPLPLAAGARGGGQVRRDQRDGARHQADRRPRARPRMSTLATPVAGGDNRHVPPRVSSPEFVGRAAELERLEAALDRAERGVAGAVFLAGESGVGKTRLLRELERRAVDRGARVLRGDCAAFGAGELAYAPIAPRCGGWGASSTRRRSRSCSDRRATSSRGSCPS